MPGTITVPLWLGSILILVGYPALIIGVVLLVRMAERVLNKLFPKKKVKNKLDQK